MKLRPAPPDLIRAARFLLDQAQLHEQDDGRILVVITYEAHERIRRAYYAHDEEATPLATKKRHHRKDEDQEHPGT